MTTPPEWRPFVRELRAATVANMHDARVKRWVTPSQAMSWLRENLTYVYDKTQPVASLHQAATRGYGACGEAAAVITAVAELRRLPWYWCIETMPDGYAHVVTYVAGVPYDVYAEKARRLRACTFTERGLHD